MEYMLFFTGLASTPDSIGLKCLTTNEIICEIKVSLPSGKATRAKYEKIKTFLNKKYRNLFGSLK